MISRLNPIYIILFFLAVTIILLFKVNEKGTELYSSNQGVNIFHKNLNEYMFFDKFNYSKNETIDIVKNIIGEIPKNLNINVKTLNTYIEIRMKGSQEQLLSNLNIFFNSKLTIEQVVMKDEKVFIKVKI